MRTSSPGAKTGGRAGAGPATEARSRYDRMSRFVTRPEIPVPLSAVMSRPRSFAIRRTTGEDRWRRSSAIEGEAGPRFVARGAEGAAWTVDEGAAAGTG